MLFPFGKSIGENNGILSASQVLQALRSKNLKGLGGPIVNSDKDRENRGAQIYAHLKALFNISGLSDLQKCAMRFAAFLTGEGMPYDAILDALSVQNRRGFYPIFRKTILYQRVFYLTVRINFLRLNYQAQNKSHIIWVRPK